MAASVLRMSSGTGEREGPLEAPLAGLVTDRVAVVEDLGAGVGEADHGGHVGGHRRLRVTGKRPRIGPGAGLHLGELVAQRQIGQRVVRGGLVGDHVDGDVAGRVPAQQLGDQVGGIAEQPDRERTPGVLRLVGQRDRVIEVVGGNVQVAMLDAPLDPALVAVDADRDAVVHGDRERLRATHAAQPGGQRDGACQRPAEALAGDRAEGLIGALQNALAADVDPRAGGHLAVHHQAGRLEFAEVLPVGPVADQVRVRDQYPRRPFMGAEHPHRLAGLHQQRLVVGQRLQGADDRVERLP